jgi:hypothetical protein
MNGTHQLLVCTNNVNIVDKDINTTKENIEALLQASRVVGKEVNTGKLSTGLSLATKMQNIITIY